MTTAVNLSVVIPTHDRPQFLREALESVLGNGFGGTMEIIVSDDSATGSAQAVVESFREPRVRYVRNPVAGMIGNWDFGVRHTTGRYVTKLDDDNRILPGYLTGCVERLEREPEVASVYAAHRVVRLPDGPDEEVIDRDYFRSEASVDGFAYARAVLINDGGFPRNQKTSAVYRREAAQRIDFYRHAREDFAFSAALGLCGRVAYIPEVLYEWRIHAESGVQDIYRTFCASHGACEGLLQLPSPVIEASRASEWFRVVRQSQAALPLCYVRTALTQYDRAAAWKLWRQLRANGQATPRAVMMACLLAGSIAPRCILNALFDWYQRSAALQTLARAIVR